MDNFEDLSSFESSDEWEPDSKDSSSEIEDDNTGSSSGNQENHRLKRTRKRQKYVSKAEKRKKSRNSGMPYTSSSGKEVNGKVFQNFDCKCKKECVGKITEAARKDIFYSFWKMNSYSEQNVFLCGLITQKAPDVRRPRNLSRNPKSVTNVYRFQVKGESIIICKTFFLKTLQVSDGRMTRAINKIRDGQQPGSDGRGRHAPENKTPDAVMNEVRDHINSFPCYQSHYTRTENPNRKFLSPEMNVRAMYNLYKEICIDKNVDSVSESIYRRTFNNEFNLHFHSPLKDTCSKCDAYDIKIKACENEQIIRQLNTQKELHLRKAEKARQVRNEDAVKARDDDSIYAVTFDLEKALPFPVLTTSIAYYKRNMYIYNFGCHDLRTSSGFMYCWDETIASRGSQEVGSCIIKHLESRALSSKHIIMWSDACTGQNRNIKLPLYLMKFIQNNNNNVEIVDHKFMVSGHSYLPNDSDFGSIEMYAKNRVIYTPEDWHTIILQCRKKNKFMLTKMTRDDFKSAANLQHCITRRKKNKDNNPINWLKIQWIRLLKDRPYTLFYKETLNEDMPFSELNLRPIRAGRPSHLANVQQDILYPRGRPVTEAKKKDMMDLLKHIPPVKHDFFLSLRTNIHNNETAPEDHGPLEIVETVDSEPEENIINSE